MGPQYFLCNGPIQWWMPESVDSYPLAFNSFLRGSRGVGHCVRLVVGTSWGCCPVYNLMKGLHAYASHGLNHRPRQYLAATEHSQGQESGVDGGQPWMGYVDGRCWVWWCDECEMLATSQGDESGIKMPGRRQNFLSAVTGVLTKCCEYNGPVVSVGDRFRDPLRYQSPEVLTSLIGNEVVLADNLLTSSRILLSHP